jgi:hypothetical protein
VTRSGYAPAATITDQPRVAVLRGHPDRRVHGRPRTTLTSLGWQTAPAADTDLTRKLKRSRGWLYAKMRKLEPDVDRGRITIPVRDDTNRLFGLRRY